MADQAATELHRNHRKRRAAVTVVWLVYRFEGMFRLEGRRRKNKSVRKPASEGGECKDTCSGDYYRPDFDNFRYGRFRWSKKDRFNVKMNYNRETISKIGFRK